MREEEITATERLNLIEDLLEKENYKEAKKHHSVLINSLVDLTISEKERLILITYRVAEYNLSFNLFDSALNKRELEYYVEMINLLTLSDSLQANAHGNFCQQFFYAQCAANIVLCLHPLLESEKKSTYTRLISRLLTAVKKEMFANADDIFRTLLRSADKLTAYHQEQLMLQAHSMVNFKLQQTTELQNAELQNTELQNTDKIYQAIIEKGLIEKQPLLSQIQFYRRAGDTYLQCQHYTLALPYYTRALNLLEIANGFTQDCEKSIGIALRAQRTALELVLMQLEIKQIFLYIKPILETKISQFKEQEQNRKDQRKIRTFTDEEENSLLEVERRFIESCWQDIQIMANQLVSIAAWPEINQLYALLEPMLDSYQNKHLKVLFRDADPQTYNAILERIFNYAKVLEKHHQLDRARSFYITLRDYLDDFPNMDLISAELLDHILAIELRDSTTFKDSNDLNVQIVWHKFRPVLQQYRSKVQPQLKTGVDAFNSAQKQYSNDVIQLLNMLAQHAQTVLGKAPCEFCFAITGSASLQALSIKSDIDVLILIEDDKFRGHCWFKQFIRLLQLYLHELDDPWTLITTEKTSLGFNKQSLGLHIDIGDLDHLLDDDVSNCWLINTPMQLAKWVIDAKSDAELILAYGLHWPRLIYASEKGRVLLNLYYQELQKLRKFTLVNSDLTPSASNARFQQGIFARIIGFNATQHPVYDLAKTYLHMHKKALEIIFDKRVEKGIDLKQDIIRPLVNFCLDLALYFNCVDVNKDMNIETICNSLLQVKHRWMQEYREFIQQIKLILNKLYLLRWQLEANNFDITNLTVVDLNGVTGRNNFGIGLTQEQYKILITIKEQILVKIRDAVSELLAPILTPKKTANPREFLLNGQIISVVKEINANQTIFANNDFSALRQQSLKHSFTQVQIDRVLNIKLEPLVNFPERGLLQLSKVKLQDEEFDLKCFKLLNVLLGRYLIRSVEPSAAVLQRIIETFENNKNRIPVICCYATLLMHQDIFGLDLLQVSSFEKRLKTLLSAYEKSPKTEGKVLHAFAKMGSIEVINYLLTNYLKDKPIVKLLGEFQRFSKKTPLHIAAEHGYVDIVQLFLQQYGADITQGTLVGHELTCLHLAAENGHEKVVEVLLKHPQINEILELKEATSKGTALHLAAEQGHLNVVKQLAGKAPLLLTIRGRYDRLPVQTAVFSDYIKSYSVQDELCEYLLSHNQALLNQDELEKLLEWAIERGLLNTVKNLLKQKIKIKQPANLLERLANRAFGKFNVPNNKRNVYMQILADLLKSDVDTTCLFERYRGNLMHMAAQEGCKEVVQALLAKGDKMIATSCGYYPLHNLAEYGEDDSELAEILITVDPILVNEPNDSKHTALHYAAARGHYQVVQMLIKYKADVNIKNCQGKTPLHLVAESRGIGDDYQREEQYAVVIQKLLAAGAKTDAKDNDGKTPLDLATIAGNEGLYRMLKDPKKLLAANLPEPQQIDNTKEEHIAEKSFDLFDNYRLKRNRVPSIVESPSSSYSVEAEEFLNPYAFSVGDDELNSQIFYENNNSKLEQEDAARDSKRMKTG